MHIICNKIIMKSKNEIINYRGEKMANVNVTIRMDEKLKEQADELFNDLGFTMSAAINMFAKQAVREQRIPFEIRRNVDRIANDENVFNISEKLIDKNCKAYKELAK